MQGILSASYQPPIGASPGIDLKRLQTTAGQTRDDAAAKARSLRQGLQEFSALLIGQMLQAMHRTVPQSGLFGNMPGQETYQALFEQEMARHLARRDVFGLTEQLGGRLLEDESNSHTMTVEKSASWNRTPAPETRTILDDLGEALQGLFPFRLPVDGTLTSDYGMRFHPIALERRWHHGIDIAAAPGTMIRAAAPGEVIFSGRQGGYGNLVILQHADGYTTRYAHNDTNLVAVGNYVRQGQAIATVGQTGHATGPHVHFEIRQHGHSVDPSPWFSSEHSHKSST